MSDPEPSQTRQTPLNALHRELGARMVPFAGYDMPVQYPAGIIAEHRHCRSAAGLFDVSHMGQVLITSASAGIDPAVELEKLVPGDIQALEQGRMRYTQFTNAQGGILDDLMVTRRPQGLMLVINAACKEADIAHLRRHMAGCNIDYLAERGLLALQGPQAAIVMERLAPGTSRMAFMSGAEFKVGGIDCFVTRSGYTGEDGYEISVPADQTDKLARLLLAQPEVKPIGLGARDSLRLEAGLCLYGHDIDTATTPIEAGLLWSISKRRREQGGFPGDTAIKADIAQGPKRCRVGLRLEGRAPAREGAEVQDASGRIVGKLTSGGFGPSVDRPIAMGYVEAALAKAGTIVSILVRGKPLAAEIVSMPFSPHRYFRG